jgi:SAM-dependent methyltransferase
VTETATPYTAEFYEGNVRSSIPSAAPVLRLLRELYAPTSIVDVGCGSGAWLTAAGELGFTTLKGYDGPWADPARFTSAAIDFTPVDLEHDEPKIEGRYDLAMSVEVAEHLSEKRSDVIVDALCAASDVVLFGAAIPGQGGVHHVNEQPQSYWVAKFIARGFTPYDVIRPAIWDNPDVKVWFKQNTLLFVKDSTSVLDRQQLDELVQPIWDLIHPEKYQVKIANLRKQWNQTQRELERRNRQLERQLERLRQRNGRLRERAKTTRARNGQLRAKVRQLSAELEAERRPWTGKRVARGVLRRVRRR